MVPIKQHLPPVFLSPRGFPEVHTHTVLGSHLRGRPTVWENIPSIKFLKHMSTCEDKFEISPSDVSQTHYRL